MNTELVSIIVPVYNCAAFLDECITSILNQNYTHFELILINDGSTDDSLSIITQYEKKDQRIVVINKKNSGVSNTRNSGISVAKGTYICFIDGDDSVSPDYLSSFFNHNHGDKLIIQHVKRGSSVVGDFKYGLYKTKTDYGSLFLENKLLYHGGPVSKLFSRTILIEKSIRFNPELSYGEDLMFFLHYLDHVEEVEIINSSGYYYRYNSNSLSTKKHTFESIFAFFKEINRFFLNKKITENSLKKYVFSSIWDLIETSIDQGIIHHKINKKERNNLLNRLQNEIHDDYFKYTKPFRKLIYFLLKTKQYQLLIEIKKKVSLLKNQSR